MDAKLLRTPAGRLLVTRPRHHALGLLIVDVLIGLHVARTSRAPLLVLRGEHGEDSPMLRLTADGVRRLDVRLLHIRVASRIWTLLLAVFRFGRRVRHPRNYLIDGLLFVNDGVARGTAPAMHFPRIARKLFNGVVRDLQAWLVDREGRGQGRRHGPWRRHVADFLDRFKVGKFDREADPRERVLDRRNRVAARLESARRPSPPGREVHHGYDVRELSASRPLNVRLSPADEETGRRFAESAGLLGRPFVALHVRDGGSKRDAETGGFDRDVARDAQIESYFEAIDALVARGFTVVRIGDPGMAPVERPGVLDLATHAQHTLLHDLWCVKNSRFFIAGDSGPYMLSWLFNVPCLAVNITNVLGVFPLRRADLYLIKGVQETATGRMVPLSEMLTDEFIGSLRRRLNKEKAFRYVDNEAADIRDAAVEMAEGLREQPLETPLQREYRARIDAIRSGPLVKAKLHEKAGTDVVFLGEGRVARVFVDRHFHGASGQV